MLPVLGDAVQTVVSSPPAGADASYWVIAILLSVLFSIIMQVMSLLRDKQNQTQTGFDNEEKDMLKDLHKWHEAHKSSFGWEDRDKINKLYDWHDVKDEDGLPVWYVNRALRRVVEETSEMISDIKDILRDLNVTVQNNTEVVKMALHAMMNLDKEPT